MGFGTLFGLSVSAVLALVLTRAGLRHYAVQWFEFLLWLLSCLTVSALAPSRAAGVTLLLLVSAIQLCRLALERRHAWALAAGLSGVALYGAFLPGGFLSSPLLMIPAGSGVFVHASLHVVVWVLALNLVALSRRIKTRGFSRLSGWWSILAIFGPVVLAFAVGWYLAGIEFDVTKIRVWSGLQQNDTLRVLFALLAHALTIAVIEESFFRGVLLPLLFRVARRRMQLSPGVAQNFSLVVSALLFGIAHLHLGWVWVLGAAIAGIGYGQAYIYRNGLILPVIIHSTVVMLLTGMFR